MAAAREFVSTYFSPAEVLVPDILDPSTPCTPTSLQCTIKYRPNIDKVDHAMSKPMGPDTAGNGVISQHCKWMHAQLQYIQEREVL